MKSNKSGAKTSSQFSSHECDSILIRSTDVYLKYFYADILHVEASGSYSSFCLMDKSCVVAAHRLSAVEEHLPCSHFVRIHRSFIVNWHYIDAYAGTTVRVGGKWFPLGESYKKRVLACLNILDTLRGGRDNK